MVDREVMAEKRRALDEEVLRLIREGAGRFAIIAGRVSTTFTDGLRGKGNLHWRPVDRSLQRLRKAGLIVCSGNAWSAV